MIYSLQGALNTKNLLKLLAEKWQEPWKLKDDLEKNGERAWNQKVITEIQIRLKRSVETNHKSNLKEIMKEDK